MPEPEYVWLPREDILQFEEIERLVARYGYQIEDYRITSTGACPGCATPVPGRWRTAPDVLTSDLKPLTLDLDL